jgi:hypothetical protein
MYVCVYACMHERERKREREYVSLRYRAHFWT